MAGRQPHLDHTVQDSRRAKGLEAVKGEIGQRWPMTRLLDVLKEAALDTGLLEAFETSASRVPCRARCWIGGLVPLCGQCPICRNFTSFADKRSGTRQTIVIRTLRNLLSFAAKSLHQRSKGFPSQKVGRINLTFPTKFCGILPAASSRKSKHRLFHHWQEDRGARRGTGRGGAQSCRAP